MLHVYKSINVLSNEVRGLKQNIIATQKIIDGKEKVIETLTRQVREWEVKNEKSTESNGSTRE